jgi:vacuolar-type H+-ATPase subunit I/STV1
MGAFSKVEGEWERELDRLPERIETVEQALEAIEQLALNGYKQIKTAEDVSLERVSELYAKISVMRERLLNIAYLARYAKRILQQQRG